MVYVVDWSRLSRSVEDLLRLIQEFNGKSVKLISLKENFDTSTSMGKLMITVIGAIYEFQRAYILEAQADTKAEEILAQIREGIIPEGVFSDGNFYSYQCPIDDKQQLSVEAEVTGDSYVIKKWKKEYIGEWKADDTIKVWGGMEEITE